MLNAKCKVPISQCLCVWVSERQKYPEEPIFGDITILTCVYKQFLTYVTHNMEDRVKTVV